MPILEAKAHQSAMWRLLRAIRDYLFRGGRTSASQTHPGVKQPHACDAESEMNRAQTTRQRLAEAVVRLERLDAERERRGGLRLGTSAENRIIWGELIELELQEIDEQVSRICNPTARSADAAAESNLRVRGPYECDDS